MNIHRTSSIFLVSTLFISIGMSAQQQTGTSTQSGSKATSSRRASDRPGQLEDGEAGYKIGCSAAASLGLPSCGELPSGRQFQPPQSKPKKENPSPAPTSGCNGCKSQK